MKKILAVALLTLATQSCLRDPSFTVGGQVTGLTGTVVLQNNKSDNLTVTKSGTFTFSKKLEQDEPYSVTVLTIPTGQTCTITKAKGTILGPVTTVLVSCKSMTTSQSATTVNASVAALALSVNCQPSSLCTTTQNNALTGNPRTITLTNSGSVAAKNIVVSTSGIPAGTDITTDSCTGTLAAGATCAITLTPGITATSDAGGFPCTLGTVPVPGTIGFISDNADAVTTDIVVLGYLCIYEGGLVFSIDDTTTNTGSVGGKSLSLTDVAAPYISTGPQSSSIIWSSNGNSSNPSDVDNTAIFGISDNSTPLTPDPSTGQVTGQIACDGINDGACDTNNIYTYYQTAASGAPVNLSYYAAGLCKQTINGFTDWYLPALCEMIPSGFPNCSLSIQKVANTLPSLIGDFNAAIPSTSCSPPLGSDCVAGEYWNSTEYHANPGQISLLEFFNVNGNIFATGTKDHQLGVRCARAF